MCCPLCEWCLIFGAFLVDKFGTDLVISIDTLVDEITNIAKPKPDRAEKIKARMLYEASQVSSMAS